MVGSAILFGYISGIENIFAAPISGSFGWFFIVPEVFCVGMQWIIYKPYLGQKWHRAPIFGGFFAIVGAFVVAILVPKEQNNELNFWIAGFFRVQVLHYFLLVAFIILKY